jgi:hypothetical protein
MMIIYHKISSLKLDLENIINNLKNPKLVENLVKAKEMMIFYKNKSRKFQDLQNMK